MARRTRARVRQTPAISEQLTKVAQEWQTVPLNTLTQVYDPVAKVMVTLLPNMLRSLLQRIWQYVQPTSQPQTTCNHTTPGPPHPASSPAGSS
ncbi:hypothetical protein J4Q44_G00297690 [Coregonus suidteri]|uniref:Uncharacterized protein n=1 Tax=Coregonus suidteri TaxID=861788 RepID=A0AAN8QID9_9TELE